MIVTQLFRSFCGWFTFLPPSKEFLPSFYDYPEAIYCIIGTVDCSGDPREQEQLPFVTFFSGHVAMAVILANHMYMRKHYIPAVGLHVVNLLQIIRLLATRGHYSIDMIIGWVVAVYVSNPAERLGRYYSRGLQFKRMNKFTARDAFESFAGVRDVKIGTQYDSHDNLVGMKNTSAAKLAKNYMQQSFVELKAEVKTLNKQQILSKIDTYIEGGQARGQKMYADISNAGTKLANTMDRISGVSFDEESDEEVDGRVGSNSPASRTRLRTAGGNG